MAPDDNATIRLSSFERHLLAFMVLHNSATVLVGRYTRSSTSPDDLYSIQHLILVTECVKFLFAAILEERSEHWGLKNSIQTHVVATPQDTLKMLFPALLYLVQNSMLMVGLTNLEAPVFQVLYQSKLVLTAAISVIILRRSYRLTQWLCIVAVSLGVAIVVDGERGLEFSPDFKLVSITGFGAVIIAGLASSLATVYFEKVVKAPRQPSGSLDTSGITNEGSEETSFAGPLHSSPCPASLWMRTMQLSFFSILIVIIKGSLGFSAGYPVPSFFHGFTSWVWILVMVQALGGVLVSAVIRYADSVLKGLATSVSVILSTALSVALFGTALSSSFYIGATVIIGSVAIFGTYVVYDTTNHGFSFLRPTPSGGRPDMGMQNAEDSLSAPLLVV